MPGDMSLAHFGGFVYGQLFVKLPVPSASFRGKTVIVTGSNTGLGMEAARRIVSLGAAKLILAVRSIAKGDAAKKNIEASTKCDTSIIEVWPLDLGLYTSVKDFAARVIKDLPRLDVLLENAGIAMERWTWAEDNEASITVNVVSTFLLAFLLLPKLRETAAKFNTRPVLTIVSCVVHYLVDFKEKDSPEGIFENLRDEKKSNMKERYQISKLLEVYMVREMTARRPAENYPVTINMLNPGLCKSELSREGNWVVSTMKFFLARTTEEGSRTLVHAASSGPETHGQYLDRCMARAPASVVRSTEGQVTQKKIWDELMEKLEKISPGVSGNL